ncbi:DUF7331 family protein [Halosimplex salinum]|uniref:DUF7331 family protein n=1 Tax=Halosimplex salinum TaxID=1710538 RepID=UPI0013DDD8DF|nr:hypothetical protein [Halosimplex salinum]
MQERDQPSAAALRDELSAVSERYVAVEVDGDTVVFDTTDPDAWVLSDGAVDPESVR